MTFKNSLLTYIPVLTLLFLQPMYFRMASQSKACHVYVLQSLQWVTTSQRTKFKIWDIKKKRPVVWSLITFQLYPLQLTFVQFQQYL